MKSLLVITIASGSTEKRTGLCLTTQHYEGRIAMGDIITAVEGRANKNR